MSKMETIQQCITPVEANTDRARGDRDELVTDCVQITKVIACRVEYMPIKKFALTNVMATEEVLTYSLFRKEYGGGSPVRGAEAEL